MPHQTFFLVCLSFLSTAHCAISDALQKSCAGSDESDSFALFQIKTSNILISNQAESYFWPSARGSVGNYGVSKFAAIRNVSVSPSWVWQSSKGRWSNIPIGTCIDNEKNIYLTLADGIRKFDSDGNELWKYNRSSIDEQISDGGSLWNGAAYGITTKGRVFAVNMKTGSETWSTKVGVAKSLNFGQTAAHDNVVIVAALTSPGDADDTITGLSAADGSKLWTYKPAVPVWNFAASFVGDGTFVYQDLEGRAHRHHANNGTLIWKSGGWPGSWTDGQTTVGPNGIVYSVANYGNSVTSGLMTVLGGGHIPIGFLAAYRVSDGKLLWSQNVTEPPNDVPVVGRLAPGAKYSVVLPGGQQCMIGRHIYVFAFDATDGTPQWTFKGPSQQGIQVAGDGEGMSARKLNNIRETTAPNPWGQAAIDKDGTVYVGGETGHFFALRDANGDGTVDPDDSKEVSAFETGAAFVGSSGPAIADGLLAAGALDRLHVWKW